MKKINLKAFILVILLALFAFATTACNSKGEKVLPTVKKVQPTLWLEKSNGEDQDTSELYAKHGTSDVEKIAGNVLTGSHVGNHDGTKSLYLDSEFQLYYVETGKEKEKVGTDVMPWSYELLGKENILFYLTSENGLYMKKLGQDRTKLANGVMQFQMALDEKAIYILGEDNELKRVEIKDETETKIASDVMSFTVAKNGVIYTDTDVMLYKVNNEGEKEKMSKIEAVFPDTSLDGKTITYLEDYNAEKGYGELFVKTQKGDNEKVSSDVREQTLSVDGSEIYYITDDDILYRYDVASKKKMKIGSDVASYYVNGNEVAYMNNDKVLYSKEGTDEAKKLNSDIEQFGFQESGDIYFLTSDKDLFVNTEKVLPNIENLYVGKDHFYYLTVDKQIGYFLVGQEKPETLIEDIKNYSTIYAENNLLYQKQVKLSDIKGYWFDSANDHFVLFDDIKEDSVQIKTYNRYLETSKGIMSINGVSENTINLSGLINEQETEIEIKLINPKTIEFLVDGLYQGMLTKSNENALLKMKTNVDSSNSSTDTVDKDSENEGGNVEEKKDDKEKEKKDNESNNKSEIPTNDEYIADNEDIKYLVANYIESLVEAINYNEFSIVENTMVRGSNLHSMQRNLVRDLNDKGISEEVMDYKILDISNGSKPGEYKVKTNEQIKIYKADGTSKVGDYNWTYTVMYDENQVGLTDIK